jgi:hypothetical protein
MLQLWILGKGVQRNSAVTGWYFILQKPESKKNSQNASKLEPGVLLQVASFRANPWAYILKTRKCPGQALLSASTEVEDTTLTMASTKVLLN